MRQTTTYCVPYKRKRKGKTNYRKRLSLIKSGERRLVIRKTSTKIVTQIAEYSPKGDKIIAATDSYKLSSFGWKGSTKNLSAAYLTGFLLGKLASKKGVKKAILDSGMVKTTKGSKIYAALKGAKDSGLEISCNEQVIPTEGRIKGSHIKKHAEKLKQDKEKYSKYFSIYLKKGLNPEDIEKNYEETKNNIEK